MFRLLLLLLMSGCGIGQDSYREYHLINIAKTWDEARNYCMINYTDLATVGSHDDMKRLVNMTAASGVTAEIWIGLRQTGPASWLWSVGESQTSAGLVEYTNWASLQNSSVDCGGMRNDGKWIAAPCENLYPCVCQSDTGLHVITQQQNWLQAQEYCRLHYIDLASSRNPTENQALQQIFHDSGLSPSLVWIGLFRDDWKWADQSDSSFRYWNSGQPNNDGDCVLYNPNNKAWYDRGCASTHPFHCYMEKKKRNITIVKVEIKSNLHLDFNEAAVSRDSLNQIQGKFKTVKLKWRVQPDGNIFHKRVKKSKQHEECDNR